MRGTAEAAKKKKITHVYSHMAHQTRVMWKTNIMALVMNSVRSYGTLRSRVIIDDKGALDVDLDGSWIGDGLLQATTPGGGIGCGRGHVVSMA